MNKSALIKKIVAALGDEIELYVKSARAARAEATHEQSKAENKYDTRGLEASYLARGQSRQVAEIEAAREEFRKLAPREFGPQDPIDLGALVELETRGEKLFYFIGPRAGGTEVVFSKKTILVITPPSPLGQQLAGKKQGDKLQIEIGGMKDTYKITSVA
jgi:transcription elongation GreA/GreB family factor